MNYGWTKLAKVLPMTTHTVMANILKPIWTAVIHNKVTQGSFGCCFNQKITKILMFFPHNDVSNLCTNALLTQKHHPELMLMLTACFCECVSTGSSLLHPKPLDILQSYKADIQTSYLDG